MRRSEKAEMSSDAIELSFDDSRYYVLPSTYQSLSVYSYTPQQPL